MDGGSVVTQTYERAGIRFRYPSTWTVTMDDSGEGWSVTVQSPETAFLLVSVRPDADDPAELAEMALDALRGDYQEIDIQEITDTVAGQPAVGHNIEFMTLDTPVQCWTRCVFGPIGVVLVMGQTAEHDRGRNEPVLRAICASFEIDEDE